MSNLINIKAASVLLNVQPVTIYRLCKQREIPYRRVGHKIMFSDDDISQYLNSTFVEPVSSGRGNAAAANLQ